ncbi:MULTISPECIES: protein DpdH [Hyphomicrobiales]|jgi:energy-coupling factor transporter ATP-binding protein EcfA2|uniref:protein DpdH n=1 Tax=Methylobacterium sp. CCH7-A2 TaxID=1768789 RepID=UPI00082D0D74|nr:MULTISPECIES: protein DpdH [Hyphomicrobiales]
MMRNYLCWDPGAVRQVINPFAEHIGDSLFRAVHSDWDLKVSPQVGKSFQDIGEASWADVTPAAFLDDFLRGDRPHALAAILGETGSGKSHLIHWMRLNIKPSKERVVLVVRKSGTSLRAIVRMLIDELPPEQQGSFLETLQSAGDGTQSRDDQKQQLLNDLAQVIREEVLPPEADEIEQELLVCLPNLFQDPHMRHAHFLGDNSVVAEIVDHIFAPSNAKDRPDRRRAFVDGDLPLGGMDFAHASRLARNAINVIELDPAVNLPLAIRIINRNLERAVARTLSFSGDRVEELMTRLRSYLKTQGKELVLLVEEFARLQGIDRPLLQAVTSQGDDRQCKMRTAIAVTTGFFQSVAETAYMRTTHIVDMDRSAGRAEGRSVTPVSLSQFTARYLNAVRLGRSGIEKWNEAAAPGESPRSKCNDCVHQSECHAVFGAVDGYGLYPFTQQALWNAASRADASMPERLNPRILQNDLLVEVLDNFGPEIATGAFPPFKLLQKLGGITALPVVAQDELANRNPQNFQRWAAFLELYDGTGRIVNLDDRLRAAFEIPEVPGAGAANAPAPITDAVIVDVPVQAAVSKEDRLIAQWIGGDGLDQTVATNLRLLVFSAVSNAIDWDMAGLAKATFTGKTGKPFQTASISFDRQTTQVRSDIPVKLVIPGTQVRPATAAAALQGVLRASKNEFRWEFPDGEKMLAAFLDCVEIWARSVEEQLRGICRPTPQWDRAAAATELLCIGAAIGGRIKADASIADMIDAAFSGNWAPECASTAPEMKSLYATLCKIREKLADIARSQMSSMKGGRAGAMLNPGRILGPIKDLRQAKWQLRSLPPESETEELCKTYRDVRDALPVAAAAELTVRRAWLEAMERAFGATANRAAIVNALDAARQAVAEAGIGTSNTARTLGEEIERFRSVQFDDSILAARALAKGSDVIAALPQLGRGRRSAVEAGTALAAAAQAFLDTVDQNIGANSRSLDAKNDALSASLDQIDVSLRAIEADLIAMATATGEQVDAA